MDCVTYIGVSCGAHIHYTWYYIHVLYIDESVRAHGLDNSVLARRYLMPQHTARWHNNRDASDAL